MITDVIADSNVYLQSFEPNTIVKKNLDIQKLRILLNNLGFNPVATGTQYIIEELEYYFNNNITELKNLKQAYRISAEKHNIDIKYVQWDVQSAIEVMNKYADINLLHEIFYWYDTYKRITPRFFMITMIDYLNSNTDEYKK
ncbi:MAG: hypothetical protein IKE01_01355 [Clostridia bacterium]|nr:hypothetical protein [Clostridia bacterium]